MDSFNDWRPPAATEQWIRLDTEKSLHTARDGGHNRWHPDITPLAHVAPGELIALDVRDASDAQVLGPGEFDVEASTNLDLIHPLTGPIYVDGAEIGDLLEVEIVDIVPDEWGWSSIFPGGGGVMQHHVLTPFGFKWHLENGFATSSQLPGASIPAHPFIGVLGVAPSAERHAAMLARERQVVADGGETPQPSHRFAYPDSENVVNSGLRTNPARETGGNFDTKDLTAGTRFIVPVDVPGALLSLGDVHMAQGDGESFGTAIETRAKILLRCHVMKAKSLRWTPRFPVIKIDKPVPGRHRGPTLMTTGLAYNDDDRISFQNVTLATQNALTQMVEYLVHVHDMSRAEALGLSSLVVDIRVSVIVNPPTPVVSAVLPLDVLGGLAGNWTLPG
ncbi:MAG: acetamidase [Pseudonocardiaceae bacterium]|nr:acetamidase [Pseudonocardiaceae bacterium]